MDIDADLRRKTLVSAAAVALFLVVFTAIGIVFSTDIAEGGITFTPTGGFAVVGALAGFVLLMALVGVWLDRNTGDNGGDTGDADPTE